MDPIVLRGLGALLAGALFWLMYFDLKDRLQKEPRRLLLLAFGLGVLSAALGVLVFKAVRAIGLPFHPHRMPLLFFLLVVGPIEEGVKFLAALLVFRRPEFDEPIDGLVYASAVAIGFATLENVLYLRHTTWPEQLARAAASPLTHSLFASIWGFAAGKVLLATKDRGRRAWGLGVPLVLSMLLHGLYDYAAVTLDAPYLASGLALVLWAGLIAYARRLVRRVHT